jgi:hypothetical protein
MASAPPSNSPAPAEPLYLTVIALVARIAATYFAVVAVALVADILIVDGAVFRTWPSFALQAAAAFALGFVVLRGERGLILCLLVAAGVLAGGLFPDSPGYSRRAPEPFVRTLLAIVPAAVAAYIIVRTAARPTTTKNICAPCRSGTR